MSKPRAKSLTNAMNAYETSIPRIAIAALLVVAGIAWIAVYINVAMDHAQWVEGFGREPANPIPFMSDLKLWNFAIGFGLILAGLWASAHERTPLGRGRGVVIGMLGCLIVGLIWIVTFYLVGSSTSIPVMRSLGQWNLALGMAVIATSFAFATKWK
ncbi:hypothetical protein GCM10027425_24900 [Alteromonas gracilis]